MKKSAIGILLCMVCAATAYASVFRCEVKGKTVYSDVPCTNAKRVDITNGKTPPASDVVQAYGRTTDDLRTVSRIEHQKNRDKNNELICAELARNHNSTQALAAKYPDDLWWKNRATDSLNNLQKACAGYLVPR